MKHRTRFILACVLAGAMVLAAGTLLLPGQAQADAPGPVPPGSVRGSVASYTFVNRLFTTTATIYTASPFLFRGADLSRMVTWYQDDLFVTADMSGTATVTVTPQFSNDQINWSSATYSYVANTLSQTSLVTATGVVTTENSTILTSGIVTTTSASSVVQGVQQIVLSADGTNYVQFPLVGEYIRFKVEAGGFLTTTDRVSVTVRSTFKNTQ